MEGEFHDLALSVRVEGAIAYCVFIFFLCSNDGVCWRLISCKVSAKFRRISSICRRDLGDSGFTSYLHLLWPAGGEIQLGVCGDKSGWVVYTNCIAPVACFNGNFTLTKQAVANCSGVRQSDPDVALVSRIKSGRLRIGIQRTIAQLHPCLVFFRSSIR